MPSSARYMKASQSLLEGKTYYLLGLGVLYKIAYSPARISDGTKVGVTVTNEWYT